MKIDISHKEKKQGLVFKKTLHGVELAVGFNDEEQAIIRERDLELTILMERGIPADVDADKVANRGLVKKVAIAATSGVDALGYHLTFRKLMRGPDTYFFETPIEAKNYADELKSDILPLAKAYLEGNKETGSADSFEL
ncbi:MAG: hypothetical protein QNJ29_06190 [Rhizobiaceae bacterium]|nr:hypothetical protein [Rhizobiaceae bacterium]